MTIRTFLASALLATLVACTTATPYTPSAAERAGMQAKVTQFSSDFTRGRFAAVVDVVPPKVQANLAARSGLSPAALRKQVIAQTRQVSKVVKIVSYGMATDQAKFEQLPSGRSYALIPTQTVVQLPSGRQMQSNNTTLAFQDGGKWYLVRIDEDTQRNLLVQAYPEFAGLRVAKGTTKAIG